MSAKPLITGTRAWGCDRGHAAGPHPGARHLHGQRPARGPGVSARVHHPGRRLRPGRSGDAL